MPVDLTRTHLPPLAFDRLRDVCYKLHVNGERRETRRDKVIFELGRGLLLGGLAATIFRGEIHPAIPGFAIVVGIALLVHYIRKENP